VVPLLPGGAGPLRTLTARLMRRPLSAGWTPARQRRRAMNSNLPTGTVTFLFTDLEGSTKLWEKYPEAMKAALAKHDALLRQAVESNNGSIIKTTGDGIHAVFEAAADGIAAAIAVQQALISQKWDEIRPQALRVRIGLHTGEAELRAGDYYGQALNRAARLASVAHAGQILISSATAELVREQLPANVALRDLGEHRLKDLVRPERVFQLTHPALVDEFPRIQSLDSFPNNLPIQLTSFIGRERELTEAKRLLLPSHSGRRVGAEGAHLLTLSGPGGTGKTRLSLQLAAELLPTFSDGVWFVELAPLADPALLLQTIASVFGLREQRGMSLHELLVNYLRAKQLLLILDNCEHLVQACAQLADQFLHASPNLRIIASSREALGISGETILRVPSLSSPDPAQVTLEALVQLEAVQLFVERATAANPQFRLTDRNASYVAQICRRLDGIPLALELAAARVTLFSPQQIASRLDNRFKLLTGGSRTALPRQQTLRALIDWSYDMLSEPERALFRRLSVFAGGWTFEAAESIGGDLDMLNSLTQLVNKSLVTVDDESGQTRYRLLETIRQYCRDKLSEVGAADELRNRHLEYFADFADVGGAKIDTLDVLEWLPRLAAEYDNFRTALEWGLDNNVEAALRLVAALFPFWFRRGHTVEGINWTSEALARAERLPKLEGEAARRQMLIHATAWQAKASLAYLNDNPTALIAEEACIALARQLGNKPMLGMSLAVAGSVKILLGDPAGALAAIEESLNIARASGDKYGLGIALGMLAQFSSMVNHDFEAARAYEAEGLALLSGHENSWGAIQFFFASARDASLRGDYPAARARFVKSLPMFQQIGDEHRVNMIQSELAHLERYEGHYQLAEAAYRKTILVWQQLGHRAAVAHQLESFASVAKAQEQAERAARLFGAAESLREKINIPMSPQERLEYDREVSDLRQAMDEKLFASLWAEGRALTMEQAIVYASESDHRQAAGSHSVPLHASG
jgi:predicted ATPase/class 3 adenylate cyclase